MLIHLSRKTPRQRRNEMLFKTPAISIISVLIASILGATGQFLIAHAAKRPHTGIVKLIFDPHFLAGAIAYALVLALFAISFKSGGTVRVVYPLYASTFIWALIIGSVTVHQPISLIQMFGSVLLITGVICMTS